MEFTLLRETNTEDKDWLDADLGELPLGEEVALMDDGELTKIIEKNRSCNLEQGRFSLSASYNHQEKEG